MKEGYDILSEKLEDLNDTIGRVHEEVEIQNVTSIFLPPSSIHFNSFCFRHFKTGHVGTNECGRSCNEKCNGYINGQNKGLLTDNR